MDMDMDMYMCMLHAHVHGHAHVHVHGHVHVQAWGQEGAVTRGKVRAARAAQLVAEAAVGLHAQALERQPALFEAPLLACFLYDIS